MNSRETVPLSLQTSKKRASAQGTEFPVDIIYGDRAGAVGVPPASGLGDGRRADAWRTGIGVSFGLNCLEDAPSVFRVPVEVQSLEPVARRATRGGVIFARVSTMAPTFLR